MFGTALTETCIAQMYQLIEYLSRSKSFENFYSCVFFGSYPCYVESNTISCTLYKPTQRMKKKV